MMVLAALSAVVLACVLVIASVGKFRNFAAAKVTAQEFGVVPLLAGPLVGFVAGAELAAAGLLLTPGWLRVGAAVTVALLVVFTAVAAVALARGRHPTCACFGQRRPTPIGMLTLVRNLALIAAAVVALLPAAPSFWWSGLRGLSVSVAVLAAFVVLVLTAAGWVLVELMRQQGRLLLRIEALEQREQPEQPRSSMPSLLPEPVQLPDVALPDQAGRVRTLADLHDPDMPLMVLFTDADCVTCQKLLPGVLAADREGTLGVPLAVVSRQADGELGTRSLVDAAGALADQFGVTGVPSAVLVDADGRVSFEVAGGPRAITALLRTARTHPPPHDRNVIALADPFARRASAG